MTWLQTGVTLAAIGGFLWLGWVAWSRDDKDFAEVEQRERGLKTMSEWPTEAADVQPSVKVIHKEEQ